MVTDKDKILCRNYFFSRKYLSSGKWKLVQVFQNIRNQCFRKTRSLFLQGKRVFCIEEWGNKFLSAISQKTGLLMHSTMRIQNLTYTVNRIIILSTLHTIILCHTACTCVLYWNNKSNLCSRGGGGGRTVHSSDNKSQNPLWRQSEDS